MIANVPASFEPAPNYPLCTDEADPLQLTDGVLSAGYNSAVDGPGARSIWAQKTTVGWSQVTPVSIAFDLGKPQSIGVIEVNAAAGASGVYWPRAIAIMLSDDNKSWRYAGELISLSSSHGMPPIEEYSVHKFSTLDLRERARYVTFVVTVSGTPYFFADEIRILASASTGARQPGAREFSDINAARQFVIDNSTRFGIGQRIARDYVAITAEIDGARLPLARKTVLKQRLEASREQFAALPIPADRDFQTILPLNAPHRAMLSVHGALLAARGLPPFFAWKNHRYEYVEWLNLPAQAGRAPSAVAVKLLSGERGSDAFWIGNASEKPQTVRLRIPAPPGAKTGWLRVSRVPWTDTAQNAPVATALLPLKSNGDVYNLDLPAGMTGKVWLTIDAAYLPVGARRTTITAYGAGHTVRIPLDVRVARPRMARARLGFSMWDYTDREGAYGLTKQNLLPAIALMREYDVDSTWGTPSVMPAATAEHFDANHKLIRPLDFSVMDEWIRRWPAARRYCIFANLQQTNFAGTTMGSPEFDARVGSWVRALAQHMRDLKLKPEQLVLLVFDEPSADEHDAVIAGWLKAMRAAAPEISYFSDPVWPDPNVAKHQAAFNLPKILCPNVQIFMNNRELSEKYYSSKQANGQEMWFYECSAPARITDPTLYFRMPAWLAFRYGATAVNFWSMADSGGAVNSWNEYTSGRSLSFTPAFLGEKSAHASIQLAAIQEGLRDYELLTMLREAASRTTNKGLKQEAQRLLSPAAMDEICPTANDYRWLAAKNHGQFDTVRLKAMDLLEKIDLQGRQG